MRQRLAVLSALAAVVTAGLCVCPERPLYRSGDTVVEATLNGTPVRAEAFSVAFVPRRTYVHIPSLTNSVYAWFGVNWEHGIVGVSGRPYKRVPGIRTVRKAGPIGVGLLNPKIEDNWNVEAGANRMSFSNATLQVLVERR